MICPLYCVPPGPYVWTLFIIRKLSLVRIDVCLLKDAKQCLTVQSLTAFIVQSSLVALQHCLLSFRRQTNIKISRDSGTKWFMLVIPKIWQDAFTSFIDSHGEWQSLWYSVLILLTRIRFWLKTLCHISKAISRLRSF